MQSNQYINRPNPFQRREPLGVGMRTHVRHKSILDRMNRMNRILKLILSILFILSKSVQELRLRQQCVKVCSCVQMGCFGFKPISPVDLQSGLGE